MENGGGSEGSQKPSERFYTLPIPFSLYTCELRQRVNEPKKFKGGNKMKNKKILGLLSQFVVTKGVDTDVKKLVNFDNPLYFVTSMGEQYVPEKVTSNKDVFKEINDDLLLKVGDEDLEVIEEQEEKGLITLEELDFDDFSNLDFDEFDINKAVKDLRISSELIKATMEYGHFVVVSSGTKNSPSRYFFQNVSKKSMIPLFFYPNHKNNIGVIKQENGSDLYFLDGFVTRTEATFTKDIYINELILKAYLNTMVNGGFSADGFDGKLHGSLKQIFNFFVYKIKMGYWNPKVSYVSLIGGRNREDWKLRADVVSNIKGEVCWLKETEKFDSVLQRVEFVFSNTRVARTSTTQGEKFTLMNSPEEARNWESKFTQGKYDLSASLAPTMKVDKEMKRYNLIFGTIVNEFDNNQYGNALWQEDYAGKTHCFIDNILLRIKYSTQKATSKITVTDNNGNDIQDWIIAPINEMSSEEGFIEEEKMDNILQLIHMGLTPEPVIITVNGLSYQAIMFREIYQYIDYLTSSDYNVDKSFELKPYSTMFSCVSNHIATTMGEDKLDDFLHRLTGLINHKKLNAVANLAGKEVKQATIVIK